jgi:hypothetical protein
VVLSLISALLAIYCKGQFSTLLSLGQLFPTVLHRSGVCQEDGLRKVFVVMRGFFFSRCSSASTREKYILQPLAELVFTGQKSRPVVEDELVPHVSSASFRAG